MTTRTKPEGSGRQQLYGEKVKRIMISIPASKEAEIKEKIDKILITYIPENKIKKV